METPSLTVAVVMQRMPLANRWQPFQWKPTEISADPQLASCPRRCLLNDDADTRRSG